MTTHPTWTVRAVPTAAVLGGGTAEVTALEPLIDLHSHILPGIDDGSERDRDSVEMARLAAADGISVVACTPHRGYSYDTTPERVVDGIEALQPQIDATGIPLRLVSGLEIAIDRAIQMDEQELRAATLGGNGRWLLIEMPFHGWPLELPDLLTALEVRGFSAVIAHPERSQSVQAMPDRMRDIVGRGAIVQLTAASLTGENGPRALRCAEHLLHAGFAHIIASDLSAREQIVWHALGLSERAPLPSRTMVINSPDSYATPIARRRMRRNSSSSCMIWSAGRATMTASGSACCTNNAASPMQGAVFRPCGSTMIFSIGS